MKNKNILIAGVGLCGSGKSETSEFFRQRGYTILYFGSLTLQELKKRNWEMNPENETKIREELRRQYGMHAYALLNLEKIKKALENGSVFIDGLYSLSEYLVLREQFSKFFVLCLFTSPRIRYDRLEKRTFRPLSKEQVWKRDLAEIQNLEKAGPIALADFIIQNDHGKEELKRDLKQLLDQIEQLA